MIYSICKENESVYIYVFESYLHRHLLVMFAFQIYISFVSALIVTPATLLVIYLFKMSKRTPKISDEVLYKRGGRSCCRNLPVIDNWLEKELEKSIKLEKELISKGYPEIKVKFF